MVRAGDRPFILKGNHHSPSWGQRVFFCFEVHIFLKVGTVV